MSTTEESTAVQMVFEEFGFRSFLAMPAQPLSLLDWQAQRPSLPANTAGIGVVVDAGVRHLSVSSALSKIRMKAFLVTTETAS